MEAFYRYVYPKTWNTIVNNYHLLIFGLFATILGFQEIKILFVLDVSQPDFLTSLLTALFNIFTTFAVAQNLNIANLLIFLQLLGLLIVMAIILVMSVAPQGALIYASAQKPLVRKDSNFLKYLGVGVEKFWPLLGLNFANVLIGYFFIVLIVEPLISFVAASTPPGYLALITSIFTFLILLPLVAIISFVTRYGAAYIILKNQKFSKAFVNGWLLFRANWLITIENAVVLMFITAVYFLAIFSIFISAFTAFMLFNLFITSFSGIFSMVIMLIGALVLIFIFLVSASIFGAYYNMIWANIWRHLTGPEPSHSKIHRLAAKHLPALTK